MARKPRITGPGYFGSDKAVKDSLKKNKASEIRQLKDGDSLTIRFLGEPDTWYGYHEHWLSSGPIPCVADDCEGCNSDDESERRKPLKYLVNVYCADEGKVLALKLGKQIADNAFAFYERKGTILDRDFEYSRVGGGMNDTKYFLTPDAPSRFSKKVKLKDLEALAMAMLGYDDEEDGEEEERPARRTRPNRTRDVDPYEDDDEEDNEPPRRRAVKRSVAKSSARSVRRTR